MKISEVQKEVLGDLECASRVCSSEWCRPLDLGGSNGSPHSSTLAALARKGLVQSKQRGAKDPPEGENGRRIFATRGAKVYRITKAGLAAIGKGQAG